MSEKLKPPVGTVVHPRLAFRYLPHFAAGGGLFGISLRAITETSWEHNLKAASRGDCYYFVDRAPLADESLRVTRERSTDVFGELFVPIH